jgi:transcriptional regulator with XRE-family HTH domain
MGIEQQLKALMAAVGLVSWRQLAQRSGLSVGQLRCMRRQGIARVQLQQLERLAVALDVPLSTLLQPQAPASPEQVFRQECDRLRLQLEQQAHSLREDFERESLTQLESWLLNWPRALAAMERNPDLPASKLVPLLQPVWKLLDHWQWQAIGQMGETVAFDPQRHSPHSGSPVPQQPVRIRCPGSEWRGRIIRRADVEVLPEQP